MTENLDSRFQQLYDQIDDLQIQVDALEKTVSMLLTVLTDAGAVVQTSHLPRREKRHG